MIGPRYYKIKTPENDPMTPLPDERVAGWEQRLAGLFAQWKTREFVWGVNDCIQLAMEMRATIYDISPASLMYHSYTSLAEGLEICRAEYGSVSSAFEHHTRQQIDIHEAVFGDVALSDGMDGTIVHVFSEKGKCWTFAPIGIVDTTNHVLRSCWRF